MKNGFIINGSIVFEPANYKLTINNKDIRLSQKECQVLEVLCLKGNSVVERITFIEPIWGDSASGDIGLNKAILLLRRKFESHNLTNLINTVPRVGYSLNAIVTDLSYNEDDELMSESVDDEQYFYENNKGAGNVKNKSITLVFITAILFVLLPIGYVTLIKGDGVNIEREIKVGKNRTYLTIDKPNLFVLKKTNELFNNENNYEFRALLSAKILSIIFYKSHVPVNQKAFLIDQDADMYAQLTCIDEYLSKNMTYNSDAQSDMLKGMTHSIIQFYGTCHENTTSVLATLYTKASHLGHDMEKDHMVLQEFLLKNKSDEDIFHIKRYVNYIGVGSDKIEMIQKSVVSDSINIKQIHTHEFYSELLSELTKNEVFHVKIESRLYISEIFGGMLYYAKKY
ncbi:winged helix-turn-helix domain-containing protein [Aeromonas dhakensis]|uniref:winged helix-turn-helix domain-containing protein n=1 Tax=Aeromonas dhakensis TaxID=196024 RepID=UPI001A8E6919|nr:winged helix-turn-helix domain-containing protein [Aeromonas dhakensis]QSR45187.1 winged helix-turn-helix domain-containing protein [Aeromonas dhakensis]